MYRFGDKGVDVKLHNMHLTPDICWFKGNSYVRVAVPFDADDYEKQYMVHTNKQGEQYLIVSVNGIGEIRWPVNNHYDLEREENKIVADYFHNLGVLPHERR